MSFVSFDQPLNESGIIFAGAGAGSAWYQTINPGGYGGGVKGGDGKKAPSHTNPGGTGGSQNSPGTNPSDASHNGGKFYGGSTHSSNYWGSGGGGGYYGGAAGQDAAATGGGGSSFFSPSLLNASTIPGNTLIPSRFSLNEKTTGNPGHGAVRITMMGYTLHLRDKLDSHYETNSTISVHIRLLSLGAGEFATVRRTFNGTTREIMTNVEDKGQDIDYNDIFYLDCKGGQYTIKYETLTKDSLTQEFTFDILVTKTPDIKVFSGMKKYYVSKDQVMLDLGILDDSYVDLYIKEGSNTLYQSQIESNYEINRTKILFKLPEYEVDSIHIVEMFATDSFGVNSTIFKYNFTIVTNRSPDVATDMTLPYYYETRNTIYLNGTVRDTDTDSNVWIVSSIDDMPSTPHYSIKLTDSNFHDFNISRSLHGLSRGIHTLNVFAVDSLDFESNRIIHQFALFNSILFQCATPQACPFEDYSILLFLVTPVIS